MLVYFHINPKTKEVFYVGIASENGKCERPYRLTNRNNYWHHYVNKHGFEVKIIHKGLSNKQACDCERDYIRLYGKRINGGQLVNLADGGESNAGYIHTQKQRLLSSERMKKRGTSHLMTPEARAKAITNISKALKGKMVGDKNPNYGNKWTDEMKRSLSEKKKGVPNGSAKKRQAIIDLFGKKVINTITGEIFPTIKSAGLSYGMKNNTLCNKLKGKRPNNTPFKYYENLQPTG